MPTLSVVVVFVPDCVQPLTPLDDVHVVSPELSLAVNTYPLSGVCPLIVKPVALTVPLTSSACPYLPGFSVTDSYPLDSTRVVVRPNINLSC